MSTDHEPSTHEVVLPLFSGLAAAQTDHPRYPTIVADPPWQTYGRAAVRWDATPNGYNDYPSMTDDEIGMLPVGMWAQDNAHLYLWCVNSNIVAAHKIAQQWGFEVKTLITWVKGRIEYDRIVHHMGLGQYYRNSTEHILFGVRGHMVTMNNDVPTALIAPRTHHSEKPDAFYDMVEHMSPGPYLDVFSRRQRMRWDTWGNEAFDFRTDGHWATQAKML